MMTIFGPIEVSSRSGSTSQMGQGMLQCTKRLKRQRILLQQKCKPCSFQLKCTREGRAIFVPNNKIMRCQSETHTQGSPMSELLDIHGTWKSMAANLATCHCGTMTVIPQMKKRTFNSINMRDSKKMLNDKPRKNREP